MSCALLPPFCHWLLLNGLVNRKTKYNAQQKPILHILAFPRVFDTMGR